MFTNFSYYIIFRFPPLTLAIWGGPENLFSVTTRTNISTPISYLSISFSVLRLLHGFSIWNQRSVYIVNVKNLPVHYSLESIVSFTYAHQHQHTERKSEMGYMLIINMGRKLSITFTKMWENYWILQTDTYLQFMVDLIRSLIYHYSEISMQFQFLIGNQLQMSHFNKLLATWCPWKTV